MRAQFESVHECSVHAGATPRSRVSVSCASVREGALRKLWKHSGEGGRCNNAAIGYIQTTRN